jgi:(p)ppGpp synthase/HD superfamily hydrolase
MSSLDTAIQIAAAAFAGKRDKAGQPYILHLLRVMFSVEDEEARIVAVLHDLLEDTPWTAERLLDEAFAPRIVEAVEALTKRSGETYEQFCARAGTNRLSRQVKLADLKDNMNIMRLAALSGEDMERLARYHSAYRKLADE